MALRAKCGTFQMQFFHCFLLKDIVHLENVECPWVIEKHQKIRACLKNSVYILSLNSLISGVEVVSIMKTSTLDAIVNFKILYTVANVVPIDGIVLKIGYNYITVTTLTIICEYF